jgi:hypothetical protein
MDAPTELFAQAYAALTELSAAPVSGLSDALLLDHVERCEAIGRLADALRVQVAAEVTERSRFELGGEGLARRMGHTRPGHLLEHLTRTSAKDVAARVVVGRMVRPRETLLGTPLPALYPAVATALTSGVIGIEAARAITRTLDEAAPTCTPQALATAERALVASAENLSADLVATQARMWRDALDPDGVEPRDDELHERRSLIFGREINGMAKISITATGIDLAELKAIYGSYASPRITPRFLSDDDVDPNDPLRETRSHEQRGYDVFMGLTRAGSRADRTRPGPRATVTVTVTQRDRDTGRGVAWLDGVDAPISLRSNELLTCGGEVREVRVDENGALLSLGTAERYFSNEQHAALAVRDGGCVWPHCTAPPSWCDAHHAQLWSRDGPTDVANGVLLCPAHHRLLHNSAFELRMAEGLPYLRAPVRLDPAQMWLRVGSARVLAFAAMARSDPRDPDASSP